MKTTIFNKKALTFFGAASVLLAAVFLNSCKTSTGGSSEAEISLLPKFAVTFSVDGVNGTLKAKGESVTKTATSPTSVQQGKTVTFTAIPETGYKVDKWTVTGGTFGAETGTDGSTTAKVKITANTKVTVSFKAAMYAIVPFGINGASLDNYLKTTASSTDVNYIKVTELTAADLKGDSSHLKPSTLGKILNDNPTKKVALKLEEIPGLTDMSLCFSDCKSLTQAPVIPNGVTNMDDCFSGCKKITAVTLKCNYVAGEFGDAFKECSALSANSIKVPAGQVQTYKDNASDMGAQADWFVADN